MPWRWSAIRSTAAQSMRSACTPATFGDALDKIDWNRGCYPLVCRKLVYLLFAGINREIELAGDPC
jgi:hypothetical protein